MTGDNWQATSSRLTVCASRRGGRVYVPHHANLCALVIYNESLMGSRLAMSWFRGLHGPRIDPTCAYNHHEWMKDGEMDQER